MARDVDRVEQLEPGHAAARGHGGDRRAARRLDVGNETRTATVCSGMPLQSQCELGDHGERPL